MPLDPLTGLEIMDTIAIDLSRRCVQCEIRTAILDGPEGQPLCKQCAVQLAFVYFPPRRQRRAQKKAERKRGKGVTR